MRGKFGSLLLAGLATPTSPGPNILQISVTETSSVEIPARKNSDGSVVLMIVDHAVHAPTDNSAARDRRTVLLMFGLGNVLQHYFNHH